MKIAVLFTLVILSFAVLTGCSGISTSIEERIRSEERIRADEQKAIQKEQNSKDLHDWAEKRGIDTKDVDAQSKSQGLNPDKVLQSTKDIIEGKNR